MEMRGAFRAKIIAKHFAFAFEMNICVWAFASNLPQYIIYYELRGDDSKRAPQNREKHGEVSRNSRSSCLEQGVVWNSPTARKLISRTTTTAWKDE